MAEAAPSASGTARERLRSAAAELMFEPTLADLTAFVTVSRLAEAADVSRGAASQAFRREMAAAPGLTAPQTVARSAFLDPPGAQEVMVGDTVELLDTVLDEAVSGPMPLPEVVARLVAGPVAQGARGESAHEYTRDWLALAVCNRDEEVRSDLARRYAAFRRLYGAVLSRLLTAMDREPVPGLDVDDLASMLTACIDGFVGHLRREPTAGEEFVVRALLGLWAGLTRPVGSGADETHASVSGVGRPHRLTAEEESAVTGAAVALHGRHGWSSVLLESVAATAEVPMGRLIRSRPDRRHLAPLVWVDLADRLERRAEDGPGDPLEALAELACRNRAASAALVGLRLDLADEPLAVPAGEDAEVVVRRLAGLVPGARDDDRALGAVEATLALAGSPSELPVGAVVSAARAVLA